MARLADLNIRLGIDNKRFKTGLGVVGKELKQSGKRFQGIANGIGLSIGQSLFDFGRGAVEAFANFERLEKGLDSITGSSTETARQLAELREASKNPGLGFEQAVKGSIKLQSVGFSAEQSKEALLQFGNAIAAAGGTASDLDGVSLALTQIQSKGKISAEEINQLAERVPQVRSAIENAFGTSDSEALQKLGISTEEFINGTVEQLSNLDRVEGGLSNAFTNFAIVATDSLVQVGTSLNDTFNITGIIDTVGSAISRAATAFTNLSTPVKAAVSVFGGLLTAVPLLINGFSSIGGVIAIISSPVTLIAAGIAALGAALVLAYNKSKPFADFVDRLAIIFKDLAIQISGELLGVFNELTRGLTIVANFLGNQVAKAFAFFGIDTEKVFDGLGLSILGFVRGVGNVLSELVTIVKEAFAGVADAAKAIQEGDFSAFLKATGEVLKKSNPIGIALTQGGRLGKAFLKGFEKEVKDELEQDTVEIGSSIVAPVIEKEDKKPKVTLPQSPTRIATTLTPLLDSSLSSIDDTITFGDKVKEETSKAIEGITSLNESFKLFRENEALERQAEAAKSMASVFSSAANSSANSFSDIGQAALDSMKDVVKAYLIQSTASFIAGAFAKLGLLGGVLAAGAGSIVGGIFNSVLGGLKVPALASGGLAFAPTLAVVGDNKNAGVDPEVIAPLSKLKAFLQPQGEGAYIASTRVSGNDLEILINRAVDKKLRTR